MERARREYKEGLNPSHYVLFVFRMAVEAWRHFSACVQHFREFCLQDVGITFSEMLVYMYQTTQHHIPEDTNVNIRCLENSMISQDVFYSRWLE
jgi:hypothetical protein